MEASSRNFFLPYISEREAAGKLTRMPGIVEAAPTRPDQSVGVWSAVVKGFSNVLDMVELRIAKSPMIQSTRKMLLPTFLVCRPIRGRFNFQLFQALQPPDRFNAFAFNSAHLVSSLCSKLAQSHAASLHYPITFVEGFGVGFPRFPKSFTASYKWLF